MSLVESAHAAPPSSAPLPVPAVPPVTAAPATGAPPPAPATGATAPPAPAAETAPPPSAPAAPPPATPSTPPPPVVSVQPMAPPGYGYGYGASNYPSQTPQFVDVIIRARNEPVVVELYHPAARPMSDLPIMRCTAPCRAHIPVGRYKLYVQEGAENLAGARAVDVLGPSTIIVDPDKPSQRTTGLVLGIGGVVSLVTGLVLVLSDLCIDGCYRNDHDSRAEVGAVFLLGGLIATPVGWVMFGKSFKPEVSVAPSMQMSFSPTVFPSPRMNAGGGTEPMPGFVLNGRF